MLYLWENSGKVQDMPAEEDQNSQKENGLTLLFENKPQIEQHVCDTPQDKSGNDQLRGMSTAAARYAEDHETERGEALQNDGRYILFLFFLPKKNTGKCKTQRDKKEHDPFPISQFIPSAGQCPEPITVSDDTLAYGKDRNND